MLRKRLLGLAAVVMAAVPAVGAASATAATPPILHITPSVHHKPPTITTPKLLVGARAQDESFTTVAQQLGSVKVTRLFYSGALPATFSRQGVPDGVTLIVSYKTPDTNVASYVKSIPAGQSVQLAWHHEPEADFATGAEFTSVFDRQATISHQANPTIPFAFIGGMYAYRTGGPGYGGSFIPSKQDVSYSDSYLPTAASIVPAASEPRLTRFRALLAGKGKSWNGFTEYGRGVIRSGASFDPAVAAARAKVIAADAAWLPTTTAKVWSYWYTTDLASGDQWRFTDAASVAAWRAAALVN